ncbi:MAG: glycosyltransferase family 2 protein [Gammaproteobacteria bacterium]|nr:glycosyltransferase family 2 protein [Gammaproteobacteria bacterium]
MNQSMLVVIGLPTCKRPQGLARLLDSIAKQRVDFEVQVLVADNDCEQQEGIKTVVRYQQQGFRFPLEAFVVPERGISQVRNALLQRAFVDCQADLLAMLDDDEWAEEEWLSSLVLVQRLTQADVVGGYVIPEFAVPAPDWVQGLPVYPVSKPQQSGYVRLIYGTTNVLLSKSILTRFPGQLFDPFYSLVGRGDVEFFTRLKKHGATFAFAHRARSHELFGASRLTKQWARERAFRDGAGDMRIMWLNNPSIKRVVIESGIIVVAGVVAGVQLLLRIKSHRRMAAQLLFMRQVGKIFGLFGKHKQVYRQIHGH